MKINLYLIFLLTFILTSCKRNTNNYDSKIIGDWCVIEDHKQKYDEKGHAFPPPPISQNNLKLGYSFMENGIYEYKLGFYRYIKEDKNNNNYKLFLGNESKYDVEDDSLKLLDISSTKWNSYKIMSINSDTLTILDSEGKLLQFLKKKKTFDQSLKFDKVIISSSGVRYPVSNISIDKNGDVTYKGLFSSYPTGLYQSKFDPELFTKIQNDFQKANWSQLNEYYDAGYTDGETVSVTFVKNNKILKTITDYGKESPIEFCWAYTPLRFFHQKLKLTKITKDNSYIDFRNITFEIKNQLCDLTDSESFYLMTLLLDAKENNLNFEKKYTIVYWANNRYKKILSDGQRFQFQLENGETKTIDLGFDFLKKNNLIKRFRKKDIL